MALRKYLQGCEWRPRRLDGADSRPGDVLKEWLAVPSLDGPVAERNTDMVETSASNLSEVLLRLFGLRERD